MKRHWFLKAIMFSCMFIAFVLLMGFVVMWLWNWLMPALFHFDSINYWQSVGLLALSRILFYPFGGRNWHRHAQHGRCGNNEEWKKKWQDKMNNMTPEERDKFKMKYEKWCGSKNWNWTEEKIST